MVRWAISASRRSANSLRLFHRPSLLGLFSIVTLLAKGLGKSARLQVSTSAWYNKKRPTFSDTLAAVRRHIWCEQGLLTSRHPTKPTKLRPALREGIVYALCHAA